MSTDPPSASAPAQDAPQQAAPARKDSFSAKSEDSQTAAEFIRTQEALEADAREALPYSIESCTKILGPLRQAVFACLTCNPAPAKPGDEWTPAGVCYACSIQCHGEHTLVEIFQKRNFTCDCGTKRIPSTSPCTLRVNEKTNTRGVHSEEPDVNNKYNHNFRNRFCGCECDYDPFQQKGTMFQCLGLGTHETGGCGEDWYHPGCLVGMGPNWFEKMEKPEKKPAKEGEEGAKLTTITEGNEDQPDATQNGAQDNAAEEEEDDEVPMPPGFPDEEAFEAFLCYKCVNAHPWIKRYAGTSGFLPAVFLNQAESAPKADQAGSAPKTEEPASNDAKTVAVDTAETSEPSSRKRKADDDAEDDTETKRVKSEAPTEEQAEKPAEQPVEEAVEKTAAPSEETSSTNGTLPCKLNNFPPAPEGQFSLFLKEGFRDAFCRCSSCFPLLNPHPQLLEEEEVYEPPLSDDGSQNGGNGGGSHGSGSLLERGESALRNVDRVRAIEGVMAYNHLKEKLKPFFQQFADSGETIGAEDIKAYFAKLRGDEQGIQEAGEKAAREGGGDGEGDNRKEQSGY